MSDPGTRPMVFIATPCFGGLVSQPYMLSVISLIRFAAEHNFDAALALLGHDSLISRSRNTLVSQFLCTPEASHLLFIDADIGFEPEQVYHMLCFDKDFVAGMYPLKAIDWSGLAVKRAVTAKEPFQTAPLHYVGTLCPGSLVEREGRFATAIFAGGGFMLLKRQMIERMIAAYPGTKYKASHAYSNAGSGENYALFDTMIDPETGLYLSEDFAFCQRWRETGGKIWLDTEGKLIHAGSCNFQGDPKIRYAAEAALRESA
ncbi:MAG TPA: hypothetical protein VFG05_05100 [Methylocella sp.]|nr:hypothetical protein [Methylocella sp.]